MAYRLFRKTLGRLAAYQDTPVGNVSQPFQATDWIAPTGCTVSLSSNRLRLSAAAAATIREFRHVGIGSRADVYLQTVHAARTTGAGGGLVARCNTIADPDTSIQYRVPGGFSGTEGLYEQIAGTDVQAAQTTGINRSLPQRYSMFVAGTEAKAYIHTPNVERSLSGLTLTAGDVGLYYSSGGGANNLDYSAFFAMRSHILRVEGPSSLGFTVQLLNSSNTVLASAVSSAGVALVDVFAARVLFPDATQIRVLRTSDSTVLVTRAPAAAVWGGDVWELRDEAAEVATETLTRGTLGRLAYYAASPVTGRSTAFATADWSAPGGVTLSLVSGRLRVALAGAGTARVPNTALAARADAQVDAVFSARSGTGPAGVMLRHDTAGPDSLELLSRSGGLTGDCLTREVDNGAVVGSVARGGNQAALPTRMGIDAVGTALRGHQVQLFLTQERTVTNVTAAGRMGVYVELTGAGHVEFGEWAACTSPRFTVTGPVGAGWRARAIQADGEVVAEATESGGVATLDLGNALARLGTVDRLEVRSSADVLIAEAEPTESLWGGDAWSIPALPLTPTGLTVDGATSDSLDVAWDAALRADRYEVERSLDGLTGWTPVYDDVALGFTDTGLAPLTEYFYRVRGVNLSGVSDWSAAASGTTLTAAPAAPLPPVVANVTRTRADAVIFGSEIPGASEYQLELATDPAGPWTLAGTILDALVFKLRDLEPETEYFVRLRYVLDDELSDPSDPVAFTTLPEDLPPAEPDDPVPPRLGLPTGLWRRRTAWVPELPSEEAP